jgi:hypothetical protein
VASKGGKVTDDFPSEQSENPRRFCFSHVIAPVHALLWEIKLGKIKVMFHLAKGPVA